MSASLVGSEMCIRDRLLPEADCAGSQHCCRCKVKTAIVPANRLDEWRACLLYTSDAADDM
eukprot:950513-Alexandrium_andersonii.AAC.1